MSTVIQVLGPGCKNCVTLAEHVHQAVARTGIDARVEKVTEYAEILALGVMRTPGLIINGEVKVMGRVPSVDEIKQMLPTC